jgi:hypothetical protein
MPSKAKDDLAHEYEELGTEFNRLKACMKEFQEQFQNLDARYQHARGSFPLTRYRDLKHMVKSITSEDIMQKVMQKRKYR